MSDFVSRVSAGERLSVCEYLTTKVEPRKWTGDDGKVSEWTNVIHTVLSGVDSVQVTERLPDGADPKAVKVPFKKFDKVVINLSALKREKGGLTATGALESLAA